MNSARGNGAHPVTDAAIRTTIDALLDARAGDATICPSDVARSLRADEDEWRALMPRIREVAAELAAQGLLVATRRGATVDATRAGGPIRLGRVRTSRG
jgi:Protein of unknown function (DUF3253)